MCRQCWYEEGLFFTHFVAQVAHRIASMKAGLSQSLDSWKHECPTSSCFLVFHIHGGNNSESLSFLGLMSPLKKHCVDCGLEPRNFAIFSGLRPQCGRNQTVWSRGGD